MDRTTITLATHTPFTELDSLLSEEDTLEPLPSPANGDDVEPETVDAFDAQILAALVSP